MHRGHFHLTGGTSIGFIKDYVVYASNLTDAPRQFHEIIANWLVSSVLHFGILIPFSHGAVFPNLWVILIDRSTISRKSTAIKIGTAILDDAVPGRMLPTRFSPESLIAVMAERDPSDCSLVRDEIAGLLDEMKRKAYMADTKDILLSLYDADRDITRTLKSETFVIKRPYLTVLGATTPPRLCRVADESDVEDGFLARFIAAVPSAHTPSFRPPRFDNARDAQLRHKLVDDLKAIYEAFQQIPTMRFETDPDTFRYYSEWVRRMEQANPESPVASRLTTSAFKIAVLHCIGEHLLDAFKAGTWTPVKKILVPFDSMDYGIRLAEGTLKATQDVYRDLRKETGLERVRSVILEHGRISRRDALRLSKVKYKEFVDLTETLREAGVIGKENDDGNIYYFPILSKPVDRKWGTKGIADR